MEGRLVMQEAWHGRKAILSCYNRLTTGDAHLVLCLQKALPVGGLLWLTCQKVVSVTQGPLRLHGLFVFIQGGFHPPRTLALSGPEGSERGWRWVFDP
jgi:hypothetical protein